MNWLTLILKFLPAALQILSIIQTQIPTAPGAVKKAIAVALISPPEADVPATGLLVDKLVVAMQSSGAFAKDAPPVVPLHDVATPAKL